MAINKVKMEEEEGVLIKAPSLCSQRWNLATISFFGSLFVYLVRVNLSVAIICMVRVPRHNITDTQTLANTSVHRHGVTDYVLTTLPADEPVLDRDTLHSTVAGNMVTLMQNAVTNVLTTVDPMSATNAEVSSEDSCGEDMTQGTKSFSDRGEFDWDKSTRSTLLSMYFYGYIFTQIPGGWLAGRYGGRCVWGVCQAVAALCTLLTPLAARVHVYFAYAIRFLLGLAAGVTFPCIHAMMGRWAPKLERSKLVSFALAGAPIGTILTFSLSGLLCVYGFDNGWGSIFYLAGAGNVLWVVTWFLVTADTPVKHKRITDRERTYILQSIGERPDTKAKITTPWRAMFTSGPLWAIISSHVFNNYTNYTLLTSLPTFMKEVLKFDIKQNGGLSALPYLCQAVVSIAAGQVADRMREKRILNTKNTRKLMQVASFLGTAVCIASAGYMTCDQRPLAVFLLCLCLCFMGLNRGGYAVNHIDLAPRHAGVLFGITNTAATVPGMIAPLVAGALTPNRSAEEWRHVFFVCAAMATLGAVIYAVLADGELQTWATPPPDEFTVTVSNDNSWGKEKATPESPPGSLWREDGRETPGEGGGGRGEQEKTISPDGGHGVVGGDHPGDEREGARVGQEGARA